MSGFLKFIGFIGVMFISIVFGGYAISVLWDWFVVAKFGLPSLSIPEAIGLSIIVSYLTKQTIKDDREIGETIAIALLKPAMALFIGWVVLKFI